MSESTSSDQDAVKAAEAAAVAVLGAAPFTLEKRGKDEANPNQALRQAESVEELMAIVGGDGEITVVSDVVGDGFQILRDKVKLVDKGFFLVDLQFHEADPENPQIGDDGGELGDFVTLYVMLKDGRKLLFNDGSTGIYRQCREMVGKGVKPPVWCPGGLTRSDYTTNVYDEKKGKDVSIQGTTYYLETEATDV